jgi:hypothetical protein
VRGEQANTLSLAWNTVALGNLKRLPPLSELLGERPRARRVQTPEQMDAMFRAWADSFR